MTVTASLPREARLRAQSDARRTLILDAARTAFRELGLDGASLREIAKRAGYTPGAIYSYFSSKEHIYASLLGESLDRLVACVHAARDACPGGEPRRVLESSATAFFDFYRDNPRDLDLGFYLFPGMQPRGLTPELDRALNERLRAALQPVERSLRDLGMTASEAVAETTALFAHTVGLLMLDHTGRIRMFRQRAHELLARYLAGLAARAGRTQRVPPSRGAPARKAP